MSSIADCLQESDLSIVGYVPETERQVRSHRAQDYGISKAFPIDRCEIVDKQLHYMVDLLDMHQKLETVVAKEVSLFRIQSDIDQKELDRLDQEKQVIFRKYAQEAAAKNNWGLVVNILQYGAAGASVIGGALLIPTAPYAGGLLLASGVAGFSNRLFKETNAWNTIASYYTKSLERQKTIAHFCEMSGLGIELGVGLAGGALAYSAGAFSLAFANRKVLSDSGAASLKLASQAAQTFAQLGRNFSECKTSGLQGKLQMLSALEEELHIGLNRQVTDARHLIETAQDMGNEMHKNIRDAEIQEA